LDNRLPRDLLSRKGARLGVTNDEPLAYDTLGSRAGDPEGAEFGIAYHINTWNPSDKFPVSITVLLVRLRPLNSPNTLDFKDPSVNSYE
jgi:hypothetical protein